jgi:hypothetical protein
MLKPNLDTNIQEAQQQVMPDLLPSIDIPRCDYYYYYYYYVVPRRQNYLSLSIADMSFPRPPWDRSPASIIWRVKR